MPNPRWEIPFDKHGRLAKHMRARATALNSRVVSISKSTHFELDSEATLIQVTARTKDMYLKWAKDLADGTDASEDYATGDDFDEYIPAGTTVELMIPLKGSTSTKGDFYDDIQIIASASGGSVVVVEK